jgi:hypothetical protein
MTTRSDMVQRDDMGWPESRDGAWLRSLELATCPDVDTSTEPASHDLGPSLPVEWPRDARLRQLWSGGTKRAVSTILTQF